MVKISKNSMELSYLIEFLSAFFANRIKDTYYFKDFLESNNGTKQFSYKFSLLLVYISIHQLS